MPPQQKTSKNGILPSILLLALGAMHASAEPLLVDIQSDGTNPADAVTQAGWNAWELPEGFATTTRSTTFIYAPTTGGSIGVSLTPATNAGARNYGIENISDPGNLSNPNVWADQYFWNNNTGGSLTVTLSNLSAGIYQFTSFHYADNLALTQTDQGTASVFLNTGSGFTDTGEDVTFTVGQNTAQAGSGRNLSAAQVMTDGTFTTSFTVANDGDPISIRYQSITGGDSFGICGFELSASGPDETPPNLVSTNPADGATNVLISSDLVATFSESIALGDSGDVTIKNLTDNTEVVISLGGADPDGTLSVSGAALTIAPAVSLQPGDEYAVEIGATVVKDLADNFHPGLVATDTPNWSFTSDGTPPTSIAMGPMVGATGVAVDAGLSLAFDEGIQKGTGSIVIKRLGDDSIVETIDVTSADVVISGGNVTIPRSVALALGTSYYIEIDAGAFTDLSGNAFAGISGNSTWTFTTETAAEAAFIKVQTTTNLAGTAPQAGWILLDGPPNDPSITGVVDGITVTVSAESDSAFGRSGGGNGTPYLNVDHTDGNLDALLSGGRFTNSGQDLRLTLSGLADGSYTIITYHHSPYNGVFDGVFEFDVLLTDANGTSVLVHDDLPNSQGATVSSATLAEVTTSFTVSGGNDVILAFSPDAGFNTGAGSDQMYLNGFKLSSAETANPLALKISQSGGNLDFEWNSMPGMQYDLLSSTGLDTPVSTWAVYDDGVMLYEAIPATGASTSLTGVLKDGPVRFFALRESEAPPLFSIDFEADNGGFTTSKVEGSDWEWGTPQSSGLGGTVNSGNGDSTKCWGTNIGNPGYYADPTTDSRLVSPVIDLTSIAGAELSFAHAIDLPTTGDQAVVRILNANTDEEIVSGVFPLTITDAHIESADWETSGPHTLPVGTPIRIVWSLTGTGDTTDDYMGWYIDDVNVVETAP